MPKIFGRTLLGPLLALTVLQVSAVGSVALAAEYPTKTVQIINPFPPGASTDIIARLISDKLSALLGQAVVVVNKSGGGGAIGIKTVKDAPADGYSVLIAPPPIALIPLARKGIGFTLNDFIALNLVGITPAVMIVKSDAPWKSMEDLVAEAKRKPGQLTFGTPGTGTSGHFAMELFKKETGVDFIHVPLGSGEAPVATAVLGGNIQTSIIGLGTAVAHIQAGGLRALVVTGAKRAKEIPDVPTTHEKGYPAIEAGPWFAFFVRAGTPADIQGRLAKALKEAIQDKEIADKLDKVGMVVENRGPEQAAKFMADYHKKWSEVARVAKIQPK